MIVSSGAFPCNPHNAEQVLTAEFLRSVVYQAGIAGGKPHRHFRQAEFPAGLVWTARVQEMNFSASMPGRGKAFCIDAYCVRIDLQQRERNPCASRILIFLKPAEHGRYLLSEIGRSIRWDRPLAHDIDRGAGCRSNIPAATSSTAVNNIVFARIVHLHYGKGSMRSLPRVVIACVSG